MQKPTPSPLHPLLPYALILSVWFIFASPYFFKGLVPFPSRYLVSFFPPWSASYATPAKNAAMPDVITQIYPWKKVTIDTWKSGAVPLWNPYSFSGTTHLANFQTAVLSPLNLLYAFFSQKDAWSIIVLLQPLLAGFGMFVCLRSLSRSVMAAAIGGISFMFCGFMVVWMAYGTLGFTVLWLPFLIHAMNGYYATRLPRYRISVSLLMALSFLSGHFQMSVYVFIMSILYSLYLTWGKKSRTEFFHIAGSLIIGICISLPQLLPSFEAYIQSVRSSSFVNGETIPWSYLITLLSPDFYGNPVTRNDWFGHYAEWAGYIGVIPLILAGYTVWRRVKEAAFFIWVALLALLLAYNSPLNSLLYALRIPVLSTSAASRIIVLFSFCLSVMSAFGIDTVLSDLRERRVASFVRFAALVGTIIAFVWVVLLFVPSFDSAKLLIAQRNLMLPSVLALLGVLALLSGFSSRRWVRTVMLSVIFVLVSFDILRFASKWMPFEPSEFVYPDNRVLLFLKEHAGLGRVFGNLGNEVASYYGLSSIEGYDALYQARYGEFIRSAGDGKVGSGGRSVVLLDKLGMYSKKILEMLGVRYVVHRLSDGESVWAYPVWKDLDTYKSVYRDEQYEVFENTKALPRAMLTSGYTIKEDPQEIITTLFDDAFTPGTTLVLEKKPIIEPRNGAGTVTIEEYMPTKIVIDTDSEQAKLLYLSDTYDPGWQAWVDERETPIYRANYDFRAVAVPPGKHRVTMKYQPLSFRVGLLISGVILGFLCIEGAYAASHRTL